MIKIYKIASINVELNADESYQELLSGYETNEQNIDMKMHLIIKQNIEEQGELKCVKESAKVYKVDGYTQAYHYDNNSCYASIKYSESYADCYVYVKDDASVNGLDKLDIAYIYMGMMFGYRISYFNGFMMHGSAIKYKDSVIIFSAPSGVGKSTQASLWKQRFNNEVTIINDDKPVIMCKNNEIYCYGTPFSGKNHINSNDSAKVKAIINVARSNTNTIEKLNNKESLVLMLEALTRSTLTTDVNINCMQTIAQILSKVSVYRLYCTPTLSAVDVAYQKIGEDI